VLSRCGHNVHEDCPDPEGEQAAIVLSNQSQSVDDVAATLLAHLR
jgi:hypothetical protein